MTPFRFARRLALSAAAIMMMCIPLIAASQEIASPIPANAYAERDGGQWDCNRGFRKDGAKCLSMNVPRNAQLTSSGLSWTCDRGFRREGDTCVEVIVPANAYAEDFEYSRGWECNRGYRRTETGCLRVSIPANASSPQSSSTRLSRPQPQR